MLSRHVVSIASTGILLWCILFPQSSWGFQQQQGAKQSESSNRNRDNLLQQCKEELKALDGKGCYHWAKEPPTWAKPQQLSSAMIEPFLFEYAMQQAIERDPKLAAAYLELGGLPNINKAIELLPQFAGSYRARADYYLFHDEHKLAEDDYSKAIELMAGSQMHRMEKEGVVYELNPADYLAPMYHYRAITRLIQGKHGEIEVDLDNALAVVNKSQQIMGSYYLLQLAWVACVYPDAKIRDAELAQKLIAKAEDYESKLSENKQNTSSISLWNRFNIVKAALAAEKGDFKKAVELEDNVRYGQIAWATPYRSHQARLTSYQNGKAIRTKELWYVSPSLY